VSSRQPANEQCSAAAAMRRHIAWISRRSALPKGSSRLIFAMKGVRRRFLSGVSSPLRRPMARDAR
jgi:hypothetical protein